MLAVSRDHNIPIQRSSSHVSLAASCYKRGKSTIPTLGFYISPFGMITKVKVLTPNSKSKSHHYQNILYHASFRFVHSDDIPILCHYLERGSNDEPSVKFTLRWSAEAILPKKATHDNPWITLDCICNKDHMTNNILCVLAPPKNAVSLRNLPTDFPMSNSETTSRLLDALLEESTTFQSKYLDITDTKSSQNITSTPPEESSIDNLRITWRDIFHSILYSVY